MADTTTESTALLPTATTVAGDVEEPPQQQQQQQVTTTAEEGTSATAPRPLSARAAYQDANLEASRTYHDTKKSNSEEAHQREGEFLKTIIFGGLDGILTSFAIVAGAAGGNLSPSVVLVLGVSNILADALAMGVGEFLSSKANNEWILSEREREVWELENYPAGEIQEMIDIYHSKGMTMEDATLVVQTMAKYKEFFVDIMMTHELELQVPDEDHVRESFGEGCVMFVSFAVFGSLPLLGYILLPLLFPLMPTEDLFVGACVITGFVLFLMGAVKSLFSAQHWFRAGSETLLLGGACATLAYNVGQWVDHGLAG